MIGMIEDEICDYIFALLSLFPAFVGNGALICEDIVSSMLMEGHVVWNSFPNLVFSTLHSFILLRTLKLTHPPKDPRCVEGSYRTTNKSIYEDIIGHEFIDL